MWAAYIFQPRVDHERIKSSAGLNISASEWRTKALTVMAVTAVDGVAGMLPPPDVMDDFSFHVHKIILQL